MHNLYAPREVRTAAATKQQGEVILKSATEKDAISTTLPSCFLIMPIADADGYEKGHFNKVYEDIFKPACASAGYEPIRADEVKQTNLIHLDILQKLIESPMAICDLSSRNPNVLFELGLRQAFDKPTVLVQDVGTPKIFDIAPLRYTEYRRELRYREVLEDQRSIAVALAATREASESGEGVNSIVKILSLAQPATLKEPAGSESNSLLQLVRAEMSEMRSDVQRVMMTVERGSNDQVMRRKNALNRLSEAQALIAESEAIKDMNAPADVIMQKLNRAQHVVTRLLSEDTPSSARTQAFEMLSRIEELERKLFSPQPRT